MKRITKKAKTKISNATSFLKTSLRSLCILTGAVFVTIAFILALSFSLFFYWISDHSVKRVSSASSKAIEYVMNLYGENNINIERLNIHYSKDKTLLFSTKCFLTKKTSKEKVSEINSLDLSFDLKNITKENKIPIYIAITDSNIELDKLTTVPLQQEENHHSNKHNLFGFLKKKASIFSSKRNLFIKELSTKNLSVSYRNNIYKIDNSTTTENNLVVLNTQINSDGKNSFVKTTIQNNDKAIRVVSKATSIPFSFLGSILPYDSFLSSPSLHNLSVDGTVQYSFDKKYHKNSIDLSLQDKNDGSSFKVEANNNKRENQLQIKDILISAGNSSLEAKGFLDISQKLKISKIKLIGKNLDFKHLLSYWPKNSLHNTRTWIKESLSEGSFNANVSFDSSNISSGNSIADIDFRDISLKYNSDFSPLTQLNGKLKFYKDKVDIDVSSGKMMDSKLYNSNATIDLLGKDLPLNIKINSSGLAKDYTQFLGKNRMNLLKDRKFEEENLQGNVESKISITIPLKSQNITDDMVVNAKADIKGVSSSILGSIRMENGDFGLLLNDKKLEIEGNADVNNYICKISLLGILDETKGVQTQVNLKTSIDDPEKFSNHFNKRILITDGSAPVDITYINSDNKEKILAKIDINEAKLTLPDIGLIKEKGDKTHLELDLVRNQNSHWKTETLVLTSPKIDAKSYMEVSPDFNKVLNMETNMNYHGNSFKIKYLLEDEKRVIKIHGSEIDLKDSNILDLANISKYSPEENSYLSVQADKVLMKNDIVFHDIVGNFECKSHHCSNSGFSMKINSGDSLSLNLDPDDNKRWTFSTNNAAGFLKGIGIYNEIEGGTLEGEMHFVENSDKDSNRVLVGELSMKRFKAVKTPTIAKLFLLSPFSALKKSMEGSSLIPFEKMKASFLYTDDKLHLNRSYAIGKSMSVSIEGSIDNKKDNIDLHGRIIPKSKFNSFLASFKGKKTPEEEKQGTLGNNFRINGNIGEPNVRINPLSAMVSFIIRLNPLWLI